MFDIRYPLSECNKALQNAGLPLTPPATGVRYSLRERLYLSESTTAGQHIDTWRLNRRAISTAAVQRRRSGDIAAGG